MSKIIVLGAGMVGSAMAMDLADQHTVVLADINKERLAYTKHKKEAITIQVLDVNKKKELQDAISDFDLVLCAVPGFLGYETLKAIIEAKKNVIDISFFPEDSLSLHELAIENNVTAIVDIGVAPGMDNLILGRLNEEMTISSFACYVGGLPKIKKWPFNYKAPFSPVDVIEEYTRPARYVENGNLVVKPALSDVELMEFDGIGTLEAFNSDGLRSIIQTMSHIPNMIEKTLRYPGHCEYIRVLKESGFFSEEESLTFNGITTSPLALTSKILFKEWKLGDEEELTVMRVLVEGKQNGKDKRVTYDLLDHYDKKTAISSMSRCTGYTATAAVNMYLNGMWKEKGVFPPELIGKDKDCFNFILEYLFQRGVVYAVTEN
jgi:saccharopine dehydrogenase-like NADP-dependent oxidoreductase